MTSCGTSSGPESTVSVIGVSAQKMATLLFNDMRASYRTQLRKEIEGMKESVDTRFPRETKPEKAKEFERGKGWGYLYAIDDLLAPLQDQTPTNKP